MTLILFLFMLRCLEWYKKVVVQCEKQQLQILISLKWVYKCHRKVVTHVNNVVRHTYVLQSISQQPAVPPMKGFFSCFFVLSFKKKSSYVFPFTLQFHFDDFAKEKKMNGSKWTAWKWYWAVSNEHAYIGYKLMDVLVSACTVCHNQQ